MDAMDGLVETYGGTLVGDVWGDLKEYGQKALGCLCCLCCSGPVMILVGIFVFIQSFTDTRMILIKEYNVDVDEWNSGPGATNLFQNKNFTMSVQTQGSKKTVLLGMAAPEEIHDKSQRSSEKFTSVVSPYYYKLDSAEAPDLFSVAADGNPTYAQALTTPYTIDIEHNGKSIKTIQSVYMMKSMNVNYKWYTSQGSSASSSSVDCRNPNYNYPGTRFSSKITCPNWCTNTVRGVWSNNGQCYSTRSSGYQSRGCCRIYYALDSACVSVKDLGGGNSFGANSPGGCVTGYSTDKAYSAATKTDFNGAANAKFGGTMGPQELQYRIYQPSPNSGNDPFDTTGALTTIGKTTQLPSNPTSGKQFSTKNIDISVRLESDPYIDASKITSGCSTCSNQIQPIYGAVCAPDQFGSGCFGMTPAQKRQLASVFLVLGALMSIFPCGVICYLKNRGGGGGGGGGGPKQNYNANAGPMGPGYAPQQGVVQQQQMFQPQQGYPQAQGYPQQQQQGYPMAQGYAPQQAQAQGYPMQQQQQGYPQAQGFAQPIQQGDVQQNLARTRDSDSDDDMFGPSY